MSKTVNAKVAKGVLLKALKEALDTKVQEKADHEKTIRDYKKSVEDFKKSIPALIKSGKLKVRSVNIHEWRDETTLSAEFDTKGLKFPKNPNDNFCEWENSEAQTQLKNAIRVLELSADEFVRTSSYSSVSQYL